MNEKSKPIKATGTYALYTFTPFKIQNIEHDSESYSLILAPLRYMKIKPELDWYSGSLKTFSVKMTFTEKDVIQPEKLYYKVFSKNSSLKYIYEYITTLDYKPYYPIYIEFSYNSLKNGYYCKLGRVLISSSKDKCPLQDRKFCDNVKKIRNNRCIYYSSEPNPYTALYTVYPYIVSIYEEVNTKNNEIIISNSLFTIYYIPVGEYKIFIDGINFMPKKDIIPPRLVYLDKGIGFRAFNIPAIKFEFDRLKLYDTIKKILNNNNEIRKWVKMKYLLFIGNKKIEEININDEKYKAIGFDAFDRLTDFLKDSEKIKDLIKKINDNKITDDEIQFASFLFLHSFAHIFLSWISANYGYGKEGIFYYIRHPLLKNDINGDKLAVYIFEEAVGGLGYLKSFKDEVKKDKNIFRKFLQRYIQENLDTCKKNVENEIRNFINNSLSNEINNPNNSPIIKQILEDVKTIYESFYYRTAVEIFPHINSVRELIASKIPPDVEEEMRAKLFDILDDSPHCWDGCPLCVMLERKCQFGVINQPFLVSRELTKAMLITMLNEINKTTDSQVINKVSKNKL